MPTLVPTIKGWVEGTDWILASISYNYDVEVMPMNIVGAPLQLTESRLVERMSAEFVVAGMRGVCPEIPESVLISNGYSGSNTLVITERVLDYEASASMSAGERHLSVSPGDGVTTFRISGSLLV